MKLQTMLLTQARKMVQMFIFQKKKEAGIGKKVDTSHKDDELKVDEFNATEFVPFEEQPDRGETELKSLEIVRDTDKDEPVEIIGPEKVTQPSGVTKRKKVKQEKIPSIPLRRSERTVKPPKWMDDYHTSAVTEVIDPRKDALTKPLMSGVLSNVSVEMANKMWNAIMQGNFNFFYLLKCFSS